MLVALGATELAAQAEPAGTERIAWLACGGIDPVPEGRVEPDELARSCRGDLACLRAGVEAARIWRDTHPAAYDAHRAYLLSVRGAARAGATDLRDAAEADYVARVAAAPDDPALAHLLAQLRLDGPEFEAELERIAGQWPDYPWAHLSLALLARADQPAERRARARAALDRFLELCPDRPGEAALALGRLGDVEAWKVHGEAVRARAVAQRDAVAAARSWSLAAKWGESDPRPGIARDIEALTAAGLPDDPAAIDALRWGLRQAGDSSSDLESRLDAHLLKVRPCAPQSAAVLERQLAAGREAERLRAPEQRDAWIESALEVVEPVRRSCPGERAPLELAIDLLRDAGPAYDTRLLAALDERQGLAGAPAIDLATLAKIYLDRGVRLDRVEALAAQAAQVGPAGAAIADRLRLQLALRSGDAARARALLDSIPDGEGVLADPERMRWAAELRCLEGEREAALEALAALLAQAPAGAPVEQAARRCWERTAPDPADTADFDAWRRAASRAADSAP